MKLLRVGEFGKEVPAILDSENKIRNLSKIIEDFNPNNLNFEIQTHYRETLSQKKSCSFHQTNPSATASITSPYSPTISPNESRMYA